MGQDNIAYLWMAEAKISSKVVHNLLEIYESPSFLLEHFDSIKDTALNPKQRELLEQSRKNLDLNQKKLESQEYGMLSERDSLFPQKLKDIEDAPYVLFYKGNLDCLNSPSVGIIGTRKPSYYGKKMAKDIANAFSELGICVVSGFAMGIDSYAHQAALQKKGKTIAVCGCGLNIEYPSSNQKLREDLIANAGLFLSEYSLDTPPVSYHFPFRNRIISALSDLVIFVEGSIKSGGMHTVNKAIEQGKPVYAVPGNIDNALSEGPNSLLASGEAKFYYAFEEALAELNIKNTVFASPSKLKESKEDELEGLQLQIYKLLRLSPRSFDELVELCKKTPDEIQIAVGYLELLEYVQRMGGNTYQIV